MSSTIIRAGRYGGSDQTVFVDGDGFKVWLHVQCMDDDKEISSTAVSIDKDVALKLIQELSKAIAVEPTERR
jgi:hypothetical protein